jgi:hypothetical protein
MKSESLKELVTEDIINITRRGLNFGGRLQQLGMENGSNCTIKYMEIDTDGNLIYHLSEENALDIDFELELDRPIWITLAYRQLSYKISPGQFWFKDGFLHSKLPLEARALDNRITDRYILPQSYNVRCQIKRTEHRATENELLVKIIDLSLNGLGISISGKDINKEILMKNDHVWIQNISHHQLEYPIFGRVVYVHERVFQDGIVELRIGLNLNSGIPKAIFDELSDMCLLILSA